MNEYENHEEERIKNSSIAFSVTIISVILLVFVAAFVATREKSTEKQLLPEEQNRFETAYSEEFPTESYINKLLVISDRETDVQYLVVISSTGVGVTTMRDTGGTVLLRE